MLHQILLGWWNQRGWDGRASSMPGRGDRNACKTLIRKSQGKKPLTRPRCICKDNDEMDTEHINMVMKLWVP
jgi:hypothetical protein